MALGVASKVKKCNHYISQQITVIKDKVLNIIINILIKNIYNYWAEAIEDINIFFNFIIKTAIIIIAELVGLIKSFVLLSQKAN